MTGETIGKGRQTATGVNEYLPAGADFAAWKETPPGSLLVSPPPGLELLATEESGTRLRLHLEAPRRNADTPGALVLPGMASERRMVSRYRWSLVPMGEVTIEVPKGRSNLEVNLEPPLVRRAGVWISALAVVLFLLALGAHSLPWFEPLYLLVGSSPGLRSSPIVGGVARGSDSGFTRW